jgi:plastocyanin
MKGILTFKGNIFKYPLPKKCMKFLVLLPLAVILVSGCTGTQNQAVVQEPETTTPPPPPVSPNTIEITSSGFSPSTLTVTTGDTVTFTNRDSSPHWPASNVHPTHTVYPGSGITKCGTAEESGIFDACRGLAQGESWSFTFNEKGTWSYHDHLHPSLGGKIIVQ